MWIYVVCGSKRLVVLGRFFRGLLVRKYISPSNQKVVWYGLIDFELQGNQGILKWRKQFKSQPTCLKPRHLQKPARTVISEYFGSLKKHWQMWSLVPWCCMFLFGPKLGPSYPGHGVHPLSLSHSSSIIYYTNTPVTTPVLSDHKWSAKSVVDCWASVELEGRKKDFKIYHKNSLILLPFSAAKKHILTLAGHS